MPTRFLPRSVYVAVSLFFAACLLDSSAVSQENAQAVDADILLKNGFLYVGDGKPAQTGHVAIQGDQIIAVGDFPLGQSKQTIECQGLVICPGFIDLHNHSDRPVLEKKTRAVTNYVTQGCTTIVTGNCGAGPVDAAEFYRAIDENGVGVNVAHLLPQGTLRRQVMGTERRTPTAEELSKMKQLTSQAMSDGVWGMSTGLIYVPSSYAETDELVELATIVGQQDGIYASHIRNEGIELLSAIDEALSIGKTANLPVHISHFKSSGKDAWGLIRVAAKKIEQSRQAGQRVTADQYPYTASSTSLGATLIPAWAFAGGPDALWSRLENEKDGERIKDAILRKLELLDGGQRLQIASYAPQPHWAGKRLAEIAKDEKMEPLELALRMQRQGGASVVNHSMTEQDVRFAMTQPWVATASDGGAKVAGPTVPHPRNYGTFPRKIGHYSIREKVISLAQAIHSATGLPADILGMQDRGYLRTGCFADIIVWDPDRFLDAATFDDPHSYSTGLVHVFVNGQPALTKGIPTGSLVGRALRKNESAVEVDRQSSSPSADPKIAEESIRS